MNSILFLLLSAQRFAGHGRGSEYSSGSGGSTFLFLIILIALCVVAIIVYDFVKRKQGKIEWSYKEFASKYKPKVKYIDDGTVITTLVFEKHLGGEVFVYLDKYCGTFLNIDDIRIHSNDLYIKKEGGIFCMYKK